MRGSRVLTAALAALLSLAAAASSEDAPPAADEDALRARVEASEGRERGAAAAALAAYLEDASRWSEAASAWRQARKLRGDLSDIEGEARVLLAFAEDVAARGESGGSVAAAFEDAKGALRRARDAGSTSVETPLGLARCAEIANDAGTRIAELKSAHAAAPEDVRPARALAAALAAVGDADEALRRCGELSDGRPADVELALSLHDAAQRSGDETRRGTAAARAVAAAPADVRGWSALWRLYAPKQRWGELADACVELAKAHPDGPWAARYAGIACSKARRFDEALDWLERAWERNRRDAVARSESAKILCYEKHDRTNAVRVYSEALAVDPNGADAYAGLYNMAARYDAEGDKAAAAKLFEALASARPNDPVARGNYANSLRFAGRYDDSEREYLAAIERFPGDAQLRNDYALLLDVEGREGDAVSVLVQAHDVDPANNDSMENLGFLARARDDRDEALKWFRMAHAALVAKGQNDHKHRISVDDQRFPLPPFR